MSIKDLLKDTVSGFLWVGEENSIWGNNSTISTPSYIFYNDPNLVEELSSSMTNWLRIATKYLRKDILHEIILKDGAITKIEEYKGNLTSGKLLYKLTKDMENDKQLNPITIFPSHTNHFLTLKMRDGENYAILKNKKGRLYYSRLEGFLYAKDMGLESFFIKEESEILALPVDEKIKRAALLPTYFVGVPTLKNLINQIGT